MSVECCVREEKNSQEFYVTNSGWNVQREAAAAETTNVEDAVTSEEFEKQNAQKLKQNLSGKKMQEQFTRETLEKVGKDETW